MAQLLLGTTAVVPVVPLRQVPTRDGTTVPVYQTKTNKESTMKLKMTPIPNFDSSDPDIVFDEDTGERAGLYWVANFEEHAVTNVVQVGAEIGEAS
jgi:hypothetical protein